MKFNREYFTQSFNVFEKNELIDNYSDECWSDAITHMKDFNLRISKSAVKISSVIKEKLNIELFPCIQKIACKGFDISGGTYAFSMVDKNGLTYNFDCRASQYKSKKAEYYISHFRTDLIISRA